MPNPKKAGLKRPLKKEDKRPVELFEKKQKKPEQYIIISIYVIVFGILAYILITSLINPNEYVLSASDSDIFDKFGILYIDNPNVFGPVEYVDGTAVRKIISDEPFNIMFNPKQPFPRDTNAEIELSLIGSGSDVYLNDELIIPNLEGYELVEDFDDSWVYANKNIELFYNKNDLISTPTVEEFLQKNFQGATIYSFKDLKPIVPDVPDFDAPDLSDSDTSAIYSCTSEGCQKITSDEGKNNQISKWSDINATFRGELTLAVFAENTLHIRFTKQDLDNYLGADEYTVKIQDITGNIFYTYVFEDGGEEKDTKKLGVEQEFEIFLDKLPRSVYYIYFIKDEYNEYEDSTLKNISINSNKVLIIGHFLPWSPIAFYTKISFPKVIGFHYWMKSMAQEIEITGQKNMVVNLDEEWLNKKYESNLINAGDYGFKINKGYLHIYSDVISMKKENWFDLPLASNTSNLYNNVNILVISKKLNPSKNQFNAKKIIPLNESLKVKVPEEAKINFEKFTLRTVE